MNFQTVVKDILKVVGAAVSIATLAACMASVPLTVEPEAPAAEPIRRQAELTFVNHIQAGLPEQDVFVIQEGQTDVAYRIEAADYGHYLEMPVYSVAEAVDHDFLMLGENPLGPYPIDTELGFTMEQWLAGRGTGTYTIYDDQAELDLVFEGLVSNAVYSVWCPTVALPPIFNIIDEPCGAADGSETVFTTDAEGNGAYHLKLASPLAKSTDLVLRSIALAYHSDGQTYGLEPGEFGHNSHVQIFASIPPADSDAWQTVPAQKLSSAK